MVKPTDIAMIGESGGMRNALVAGFLIGSNIDPTSIQAYYGASSSVGNGAFFITGQLDQAFQLWTEELTSKDVFDARRIMQRDYPANLDYLAENVCQTLDLERLIESHVRFIISTVRVSDGSTAYFEPSRENFRRVFMATCSIPVVARTIDYDDDLYVDGGLGDPMPIIQAYKDGYRRFIVLSNREKQYRDPYDMQTAIIKRLSPTSIQPAFDNLRRTYLQTWEFINNPPEGVKIYRFVPPAGSTVWGFERSKEIVQASIERGIHYGEVAREELQAFIKI